MADKMKVIVAAGIPSELEALKLNVALIEDVQVAAAVENGEELVQAVRRYNPDLMVIDLMMPVKDGLNALEELSMMSVHIPPFIATSILYNDTVIRKAMKYGAFYFLPKPYDVSYICKLIQEVMLDPPQADNTVYSSAIFSPVRSLDEEITDVFLAIGIPAHIKGYHFLREGVKLVIDDPTLINAITKELYPGIAECFHTTASKVERAIRHAIEVAWERGRLSNINQIFGCPVYNSNDKPTNGELIALLADKMKLERMKRSEEREQKSL